MTVIHGPLVYNHNNLQPLAKNILDNFIRAFCPNHTIKTIYIDTDHRTGDHLIKIILENRY